MPLRFLFWNKSRILTLPLKLGFRLVRSSFEPACILAKYSQIHSGNIFTILLKREASEASDEKNKPEGLHKVGLRVFVSCHLPATTGAAAAKGAATEAAKTTSPRAAKPTRAAKETTPATPKARVIAAGCTRPIVFGKQVVEQ